ncbi:hypothetical protein [Arsenicicoccus sp. oral taxon 190]|uniref:hypothetical protein n=1 Tax=Arsenicicoccus sp. oral taxon 190 TaxID=1658671 RepID=UPI00067A1C4F|nr:hypothetical protein [Arsenicicoccus sp. oral taxon 190]AKT50522.1 hypothetical protein ADJ73_02920 [Arsenicicoccus sp. oral taxon 190]
MILAVVMLALGVLAYGVSGARLHRGSQSEGGPLRSASWWIGTGLQGAGFLFTLVARRFLPLLLVQACVTSALAVTAIIQHVQGVRRLRASDAAAVVSVVFGIAALGFVTVTGPPPPIEPLHIWVLLVCAALCAGGLALPGGPVRNGLLSGFGFSFSAICARLLVGDHAHPLWRFWELPLLNWVAGLLIVSGMALGQIHLTKGLARGHAAPVLGCNYAMATVFPAGFGLVLLGEHPRPGSLLQLVVGLVLALAGALWLLRAEDEAGMLDDRDAHA